MAKIAHEYGIPLHVRRMDSASLVLPNFQENARLWRQSESLKVLRSYEQSESAGGGSGGATSVIATAHHLDDQVETSFMKLLRGTHLSHLHPVRGQSPNHSIEIMIMPM